MGESVEDRRLWIGNLDPRCNEYQLLKLVQKHGKIEKLDYLFHKTGPQVGLPRGYAFVTYSQHQEAVKAKEQMHNCLVGNKRIVVTWAHSMPTEAPVESSKKNDIHIPVLELNKSNPNKNNKDFKIQAIEAKLKLMEHKNDDILEINKTLAEERPVITYKQPVEKANASNSSSYSNRSNFKTRQEYSRLPRKPYEKFPKRR